VSTPDHEENRTLASYEAAVERYLEHSSPPGPEMVQYLDRFADLVGAGDVLELGSGPGWDALYLEARGLRVTRSAVADDGVLGFTVKEGDGDAWTTIKLDLPRHFTYWREPALSDALTSAGWRLHRLDHVAGRHEPWLYVLARAGKAASD